MLSEYDMTFGAQKAIRGQALANFLTDFSGSENFKVARKHPR